MVATHSCASLCRSQNIRESQQMSIQRNVDLHDLDRFGPRHSPANRRKAEPPLPPNKKKQDEPQVRGQGGNSCGESVVLCTERNGGIEERERERERELCSGAKYCL